MELTPEQMRKLIEDNLVFEIGGVKQRVKFVSDELIKSLIEEVKKADARTTSNAN